MFCVTCGSRLSSNARFCKKCGNPVRMSVAPNPHYSAPSSSQMYDASATSKSSKVVLAAAVAFIVLAGGIFVMWLVFMPVGEPRARIMSVFRVDGVAVSLRNAGGAQIDARAGMGLHAGYALSTGIGSFCYISLDADSIVKMDVSTDVSIAQLTDRLLRINIDRGQVMVNLQYQSPEYELEAIIGNTVISVRGTLFVAGVYAGGEAIITVLVGSVYVNNVRLDAGYTMRVFDGIEMIYEIEPIDFGTADEFLLSAALSIDDGGADESPQFEQDMPVIAAAVGDIIQFGNYDWRVLEVQGNQALIITDRVIDFRMYHHTYVAVTWETSEIRQWLNGGFFASFSPQDQARIAQTYVVNNNNPWYFSGPPTFGYANTPGGNNTIDRIFLLSIDEVLRYFGDSGLVARGAAIMGVDARRAYAAHGLYGVGIYDQYNDARIAIDIGGSASWWWLRSPGHRPNSAANVLDDGYLNVAGRFVFWEGVGDGVRPALWLYLD